jgi:hypothetical protein
LPAQGLQCAPGFWAIFAIWMQKHPRQPQGWSGSSQLLERLISALRDLYRLKMAEGKA